MSDDILITRPTSQLSELDLKKFVTLAEDWCSYQGATWVENDDNILDYDFFVRNIFQDKTTNEVKASVFIYTYLKNPDLAEFDNHFFLLEFWENNITESWSVSELDNWVRIIDRREPIWQSDKIPNWLSPKKDKIVSDFLFTS
ncbi:MAG: hypothetical protein AAGF26_02670 [Cyanobacteria bacterium P01_G01_bin.49]